MGSRWLVRGLPRTEEAGVGQARPHGEKNQASGRQEPENQAESSASMR
jgi:hypothetical protein